MKSRPTLFISGVSHELGSFREAAAAEIRIKGCFADIQTDFAPDYRTVEEMLRRRLRDADAVIHLVGFRYGAEPQQRPADAPRRSYTQMEFDIARELEIPLYAFLSQEADVRDAAQADEAPEDATVAALQLAHRQAVKNGNPLYYSFRDGEALRRLVAQIPIVAACDFHADISRIDKYAPAKLIGREAETRLLDDAWMQVRRAETPRPHLLAFIALGGEGKTSVVAHWAADLAHRGWPGCDTAFAWSFYSQGTRDQSAASGEVFLNEALKFFGDPTMAASAQSGHDKGKRLAQLVGERRAVLILDGLEPLQYAPTSPTPGELKDQGVAALLKALAAQNKGLCVLTSRYALTDLNAHKDKALLEIELKRLGTDAGVALLRTLGVNGPQAEFAALVEQVKGHALTLNLIGAYLHDAHGGDIRKRDLIKLDEANDEEHGGHAFHAMDAYFQWFTTGGKTAEDNRKGQRAIALLRLLGLFDRPAPADCLAALYRAPAIADLTEPLLAISEAQRNIAVSRLENAKLLTVNREPGGTLLSLDAHPLLREYFAKQLREQHPEAWRAGHKRLFEYLCESTQEGETPTLEQLQPLYQAVAHGCWAGMAQQTCEKIYGDRILRGEEYYSANKLGAFGADLGAVACFFASPWSRVAPELTPADQAWLLNDAAFRLRALGRLREALEPMRAGLEMRVEHRNWQQAAINASNLSELELTLGDLAGAVRDGEQAVGYADRSDDKFERMINRTTYADALHQSGRRDEAKVRFIEAEALQVERHPSYPLLYSLPGFRYCDLLAATAEWGAWCLMVGRDDGLQGAEWLASCREVSQRATQTLQWAEDNNLALLTIALDHLSLGRAALYQTLPTALSPSDTQPPIKQPQDPHSLFATASQHLEATVDGLRRANSQDHIPRALLTRAWLYRLTQPTTLAAQADLDEAWEIAAHGSMPLHQADIHLHRARLFGRDKSYPTPWQSPQADLAAARRLIEKHGYLRRMEELIDAEAAFGIASNVKVGAGATDGSG